MTVVVEEASRDRVERAFDYADTLIIYPAPTYMTFGSGANVFNSENG
jgi:hypothetical protein